MQESIRFLSMSSENVQYDRRWKTVGFIEIICGRSGSAGKQNEHQNIAVVRTAVVHCAYRHTRIHYIGFMTGKEPL